MMYHFILYSLKVAAVLAVFYLFYHLLLSRDTFHRLNRIVLLATAALSFVLARLAVSIFSIRRIIRGGERFPDGQGNTVVVTDKPVAPFSWLRYIVLSQTDWECEREKRPSEILLHEQAHIRYGHSLDVLVADCLGALQWFNPAIWLLKGDLRAIHEYEADAALLQQGIDAKQYQSLLVRKAMASAGYSVANSFSHSTLKNRIAMMLKSKSPLAASLKLLYILPLVGLSLAATTRTVTDYEVRGAAAESLFTQVTTDGQDPYIQGLDKQKQDTVQFKLVDVLPQFNGGDANAFAEWVDLNLKYPEAAVKNGKEGNIVVQFTVAEDGSVGSVKILRSVDPALDKETVRVVSGSPKWTPGQMDGKPVPVTFTFAVNFKLNASYCPLRGERLPLPEDR